MIADKLSGFLNEPNLSRYKYLILESSKKFILLARKIYKRLEDHQALSSNE
jgi:hypothetical protein